MDASENRGAAQEISPEVAANDGRDSVPTLITGQASIAPAITGDRASVRLPQNFADVGVQLVTHGYLIIPIKANDKRPAFSQWQNMRLSAFDIPRYANFGVGILCGVGAYPICAVDIDCEDSSVVAAVRAYCDAHLGAVAHPCLARVGQAPKVLLVTRAAEAGWTKRATPYYEDLFGGKQRIEVLGVGQQFVAYGVHPKTRAPYAWVDGLGGAIGVAAGQLPIVTADRIDALFAFVETLATAGGWRSDSGAYKPAKDPSHRSLQSSQAVPTKERRVRGEDTGDLLLTYEPPLALSCAACAELIAYQDPRPYDAWLRVGMALHHQFGAAEEGLELWDKWSQTATNYVSREDLAMRWQGFGKRSQSESAPLTMKYLVKAANGFESDQSIDQTPLDLEANIVSLAALQVDAPAHLHVVERWIPTDEVTLMAGHGGAGKSYLALSIAIHVALGRPFADLGTHKMRVLFVSAEDGVGVLRHRLSRLCSELKIDPAELDTKLILLDISDLDPALYREQRSGGNKPSVCETTMLHALAELVEKRKIGLTIIDNASDAFDGDEIRRAQVRGFIRVLRSRVARPGRAVLLLAHINKESAKAGTNADPESYSGSTAWHNSVRSRLTLSSTSKDTMKIVHGKANYGPKADPISLEWREGVPVVTSTIFDDLSLAQITPAEQARDTADKSALVALIQDFERRVEPVTTSFQGPYTVFKLLEKVRGFPMNTNRDRCNRLLRELETEGRIIRRTVNTPNRKWKQIFSCGAAPPDSAPIRPGGAP